MRITLILAAFLTLTACTTEPVAHYSPYDLNRDGVMDAVCPGMEYDPSQYLHYSWRAKGSIDCNDKVANQDQAS